MVNFFKKNFNFIVIFSLCLAIYLPSFSTFYTNDDFYFLHISNAQNLSGVLGFFNIVPEVSGNPMYRPLTTQLFYFLSVKMFGSTPLVLHLISFVVFLVVVYLVYSLTDYIFKNIKIAFLSSFLYALSATHFAHLYYLATFQELGMTAFVLLSLLVFFRKRYLLSLVFFVMALMSKETAVVTPVLICLVFLYQRFSGLKSLSFKVFFTFLSPFLLVLLSYLLLRIFYYGFATGDTYVWEFSLKTILNTLGWYILWGLNLPETLLDFIGPGFRVNPNLFIYWGEIFVPIFCLFFLELSGLFILVFKSFDLKNRKATIEQMGVIFFGIAWFIVSLLPVLFLPLHKYAFYLTLPLIAVSIVVSNMIVWSKVKNVFTIYFMIVWVVLSALTLKHTFNTSWITQGQRISARVYEYFLINELTLADKRIYFVDTQSDNNLPWSPTAVVKVALSEKNFFYAFYPKISGNVNYYGKLRPPESQNGYIIEARSFLSY